jgi:hypothetical protein
VYLLRSDNGSQEALPYPIGEVRRRPVFATLWDAAGAEDHQFVFAGGSGWLYKFDATSSAGGPLQIDVAGAGLQVRDLRRGGCPTDGVIAEAVVQRRADSNPGYTLPTDIVMVATAHACGDTAQNQVIAYDANDLTAAPLWIFNSGEYEVGAINSCQLDLARNRIYCGADVPAGMSQNGLWAIDTTTGTLAWAGLMGSSVRALPALAASDTPGEDHLYAGDHLGRLHAFAADDGTPIGDPLPVAPTSQPITHDLVAGSGVYAGVVLAVGGGRLTALSRAGDDWVVPWQTDFAGGQKVITPAATLEARGKLYVGLSDSTMHQLDFASGSDESSVSLGPTHLDTVIAPLRVYLAADGVHRVVVTQDSPITGTRTFQHRVPCQIASPECRFADRIFADGFE